MQKMYTDTVLIPITGKNRTEVEKFIATLCDENISVFVTPDSNYCIAPINPGQLAKYYPAYNNIEIFPSWSL